MEYRNYLFELPVESLHKKLTTLHLPIAARALSFQNVKMVGRESLEVTHEDC